MEWIAVVISKKMMHRLAPEELKRLHNLNQSRSQSWWRVRTRHRLSWARLTIWWMIPPPMPSFLGAQPITVSLFGTPRSSHGMFCPSISSTTTSPASSGNWIPILSMLLHRFAREWDVYYFGILELWVLQFVYRMILHRFPLEWGYMLLWHLCRLAVARHHFLH